MAVKEINIEPYLSVGCPMVLHSDPELRSAPRYPTILRGWRNPDYLLLDRPWPAGRTAPLQVAQPCVIRFVYEGKACAFGTKVMDWDSRRRNSYCRVTWPVHLQMVAFRKFERFRLQTPCRIFVGATEFDGTLQDISIGGCGLSSSIPATPGTELEVSFVLPDGCALERARCVVRNSRSAGEETFIGCEFDASQADVQSCIAFHVTTVLERRGRGDGKDFVLIIDDDPETGPLFRQLFEQHGYDALQVTGTIDGLSLLRVSRPAGLVVNYAQKDLPGLETVQLVRQTRGLDGLPVFLFGGSEPDAEARALKAGALAHLPTQLTPQQIIVAVTSRLAMLSRVSVPSAPVASA